MKSLDRRWWIAIGLAVIAVAALVLSRTVFGRPSEDCRPVLELLSFNTSQAALIESKSDDAGIPTVAEETAYQKWADGLAQRAQNVSAPDLAQTSIELADLASRFVSKFPRLRAAADNQVPGAPAPAVAYEMSVLNIQISDHLAELSKACPS